MMQSVLDLFLRRFVTVGRLTVRWPDKRTRIYAGPPGSGPEAGVELRDRRTVRRLALNPELALGEANVEGGLAPLDGSIHDVLAVLLANLRANPNGVQVTRLRRWAARVFRPLDQFNAARRAQRNVAHHYDLDGRLYSLFLDRDRQYSCAYFRDGTETLEAAQAAKKRHIAAKLCLDRPGLSVLDIGCGWGGLALTLARDYGARVTGITLSIEQLNEARAGAETEGLADRVSFELLDYRAVDRRFDRIVSVGMFEHVGVVHYHAFFGTLFRCLEPDGVALLHSIGQWDGPRTNNPWILQIHLPRRLLPGAERGDARDRAFRPVDHRHRSAAAALCRDAAPLAAALRRQPERHRRAIRRALLPHVRVLPVELRTGLPLRQHGGVPGPAGASADGRAADPRLHRPFRIS